MATYNIYSLNDLQEIADGHMADDCVLMNSIDCGDTSGWNETTPGSGIFNGFEVLSTRAGGSPNYWTGTFDGQGYTLSNIYINRPTETGVAFFGVVAGDVTNVKFTNMTIVGRSYVGSMFYTKYLTGGSWTYVDIEADITHKGGYVSYEYVGGFGANSSENVSYCNVNVVLRSNLISANTGIGGMFGYWSSGEVHHCTCIVDIQIDPTSGLLYGGYLGGFIANVFSK